MEKKIVLAIISVALIWALLIGIGINALLQTVTIPNTGQTQVEPNDLISVEPTSLYWGTVTIDSSQSKDVLVTNNKGYSVTITSITIEKPVNITSNMVSWSDIGSGVIAPSGSMTITFTLTIPNDPSYAGKSFSFDININAEA